MNDCNEDIDVLSHDDLTQMKTVVSIFAIPAIINEVGLSLNADSTDTMANERVDMIV